MERLRGGYWRRRGSGRYVNANAAHLLAYRAAVQATLALLRNSGAPPLGACRMLDVGCGDGALLRTLAGLGARPALLCGVDVLKERLQRAAAALPGAHFTLAEAGALPLPAGSVDVALQFTLFSSILEEEARRAAASEIVRVLRPGGLLVWYDFWINPGRHVRPLGRAAVRRLFPSCRLRFCRITLAPPLARLLAPRLARALGHVPLLCSHELAAIITPLTPNPTPPAAQC